MLVIGLRLRLRSIPPRGCSTIFGAARFKGHIIYHSIRLDELSRMVVVSSKSNDRLKSYELLKYSRGNGRN